MKKTKKAQVKITRSKKAVLLAIVVAALILVVAAGCAVIRSIVRYEQAYNAAMTTSIRELVINAASNTLTAAPVDFKTGDIHFPGSGLYIPAQHDGLKLNYRYEFTTGELVIASDRIFSQDVAQLYSTQKVDEVFDLVPHLQACQRGFTVSYNDNVDSEEYILSQKVALNNGKMLYVYEDGGCEELSNMKDVISQIRAF